MSNNVFNCFFRRPGCFHDCWRRAVAQYDVRALLWSDLRSRHCVMSLDTSSRVAIRFADPADRRLPQARAAGAFPFFHEHDCCGLVLVGGPGATGSCPDRSRKEAGLRVLRAVPQRADAVEFRHRHPPGADCGRSQPACRGVQLHPHLLGRERARPGASAGIEGRPESHSRHLARTRSCEKRSTRSTPRCRWPRNIRER